MLWEIWLISLAILSPGALSAQSPLVIHSPAHTPETYAETIVSALSASTQHTTFLRLLQRAKAIPMLAHIGNATVFAPTDDAWKDWADRNKPGVRSEGGKYEASGLVNGWLGPGGLDEWLQDEKEDMSARISVSGDKDGEKRLMDNQNWALRQHLLYHMLNYTLPPSAFSRSSNDEPVSVQTTLLFPLAEEPPLPPTPEPGAPWLPRGGDGLLGGHGQRLRIATAGSDQGGKRGKVGVDWQGGGGASVWSGEGWTNKAGNATARGIRWTRNGVVVGIDTVLDPPPSIEQIIRTHPSLSYLSRIIPFPSPPSPLPDSFASTPRLTVFAPSNEAFAAAFDDIERGYLEGPYGEEGVARVVGESVVLGQDVAVGWSDVLGKETDVKSTTGSHLTLSSPSPGALKVNSTSAHPVDIFASNGVLHIIPSLLLPPSFSLLNSAEKMLLSLNATRFVSLLRTEGLSERYIGKESHQEGGEEWTVLVPSDDVLDGIDRWGSVSTSMALSLQSNIIHDPEVKDPSPLTALLQYHILPGKLLPHDIHDGALLPTEMKTSLLGGGRQRLRVDVAEKDGKKHGHSGWETVGEGEVRFGGVTVVGKTVKSGNNMIYLLSSLLPLPENVLQTAVSDLHLSTFIAALYASDLARSTKRLAATTYVIPDNQAFDALGLAMSWLLTSDGKDDLRKVVRYCMVQGVVYGGDVKGRKDYETVEGGGVVLERVKGKHGGITVGSPTSWPGHDSGSSSFPANAELSPANITSLNALTDTGVIHTTDQVVLPADVEITIGKLVRGSKEGTMAELMGKAGLKWILDGREPDEEEVERAELGRWFGVTQANEEEAYPSYVLLVPTDKAFSRLNLTYYSTTPSALLSLLKLHIIPSSLPVPSNVFPPIPSPPREPQPDQPLSLNDDIAYSTLLSGESEYADVVFRSTGGGWMVGIQNVRGAGGLGDSARVGASGRASVRWLGGANAHAHEREGKDENGEGLWRGGMTLGGGVFVIDSVLIPYEPSWFSRYGLLTITLVGLGVLILATGISVGYWYYNRKKEGYQPIFEDEGEGEAEADEQA